MCCFVCRGEENVSQVTDGRTHHLVCDECRELVNALFMIHGTLAIAVVEGAQAKRGLKPPLDKSDGIS